MLLKVIDCKQQLNVFTGSFKTGAAPKLPLCGFSFTRNP